MIYQILGFSHNKTTRFKRNYGSPPFEIDELKNMIIPEQERYIFIKKDYKIVYDKYANLYVIFVISKYENEFYFLEIIKKFLSLLDLHFKKVCDTHLLYNFDIVHKILDEFILNGKIIETDNEKILKRLEDQLKSN